MEEARGRLHAYTTTLQGYIAHRLTTPAAPATQDDPSFAAETETIARLRNLTSFQKLVQYGLMNQRILGMNKCAHFLHRTGLIGGEWKNVASRLYGIVGDHPEVFQWIDKGVYELMPDAEDVIPARFRLDNQTAFPPTS